MSYKICPGTTTPATKTLSASTGITHRLCTSVLRKEEKFNHCRLDTPKTRRAFLLLVVSENTLARQAGISVCLNIIPDMTRAWVTQSVSALLFPSPWNCDAEIEIYPCEPGHLYSMICLFKWNVPDLYLTQIPNAVLHQLCKGEHPHKALGPLYFPTTISNHSSGTVTQQSVKEINNQIWHSSPISLSPFICLTLEKTDN